MQDSSPLDSLLETRPVTRPSWPQLPPRTARAQEPSRSSPTGTWGGNAGRVTPPEQPPARLEGHVSLIFLINQSNMVCQLLLFVVLSCPRLAAGRSWLPRPGTAVSTPGVCQRKKRIELLCLPALSLWHRVSQTQHAHPPSRQQQPWQELPGWVLAPPLVKAALSVHPSSQSSNSAPCALHSHNARPTNHTFSNYNPQTIAPSTRMPSFQNPRDPHLLLLPDITSTALHVPYPASAT